MLERSETDEIEAVTRALSRELGYDAAVVRTVVEVEYARWQDARVRTFVPTFVHRNARRELRDGTHRTRRTA